MKKLLFLLLLFTGPVSLAQSLPEDAHKLKTNRRDLWYADSSFASLPLNGSSTEAGTVQTRNTPLLKKITGVLGYFTGAMILAALIYAFYSFSQTPKNKKTKTEKHEEDHIDTAESLYQADFLSRIRTAEAGRHFRLALRYHYLRLLQEFSRQSLIRYEKDKTNKQYAEEIKNHKWGPDFLLATRYYNFVWYGERTLDEENYRPLAAHFKKMLPYE